MMRPRTLLVRASLALAGVVLTVVGPQSVGAEGHQQAGGPGLVGYAATASADGARQVLIAEDYILSDELVDAGAPTAQASIDGLGQSRGYAALPDPGVLARSAPGLAALFLPDVTLPDYALLVSSQHPTTPTAELRTQSYSLTANSTAQRSDATAMVGASIGEPAIGQVKSNAVAEVLPDLRRVQAAATSTVDAVSVLGGLVRIGRVESSARASQQQGGELVRSSEFKVEGASVLGQSVKINQDGLVLAGQSVPLPIGGELLDDALTDAGLRVRYLKPIETDDGVISAGLEITKLVDLPNAATPARLITVLGRTSAFVTPPATEDEALTPTNPSESAAAPELGTVAPPSASAGDLPAFETRSPAPTDTAVVGGAAPATSVDAITDRSLSALYLIIVVGASMALGGGSLFRWLAVRSPWIR